MGPPEGGGGATAGWWLATAIAATLATACAATVTAFACAATARTLATPAAWCTAEGSAGFSCNGVCDGSGPAASVDAPAVGKNAAELATRGPVAGGPSVEARDDAEAVARAGSPGFEVSAEKMGELASESKLSVARCSSRVLRGDEELTLSPASSGPSGALQSTLLSRLPRLP